MRLQRFSPAVLLLFAQSFLTIHAGTGDLLITLRPSDGTANSYFGTSVDISGTLAVVGAHRSPGDGTAIGAAYLFDTTSGTQIAKLVPSGLEGVDLLGSSVAIDGNVVAVSAPGDDDNGQSAGAVYLFDAQTGTEINKLLASDGIAGDCFGEDLDISGNTLVVGTDRNSVLPGSAYIFDLTTGTETFKLVAPGAPLNDSFGSQVAVDGTTAVIGASTDDDASTGAGAIYIFDTVSGVLKAKVLGDGARGYFGSSVAISGSTALISQPSCPLRPVVSPANYLIDTVTGARLNSLELPVPAFNSSRVALDGRIGLTSSGSFGSGAYFYDIPSGLVLNPSGFNMVGSTNAVAVSGNLAIVGDVSDSQNGSLSGAAHIVDATSADPATTTVRNGSGLNALILSRVSDAVPGANWDTDVDASAHVASLAVITAYNSPTNGIFLPGGELLVDLSSGLAASLAKAHQGNTVRFSIPIPADGTLFGFETSAQAIVLGSPAYELSNALDIVVGF